MVSFKVNTIKLKKAFGQLKAGVGRMSSHNKSFQCEITVTDNLVTFTVPGVQIKIPCLTNGTVKATTGFFRLYNIVNDETNKEMFFEIGEDTMKMGILSIPVLSCYFKDDKILRSIDLPINFKDIDLLQLELKGFTSEEITFNKLNPLKEQAEINLKKNIDSAYDELNKYGITYHELEMFVKNRIYGISKWE